jgi:hypothetical protein
MKDETREEFVQALGYSDEQAFEAITGMKITASNSWRSNAFCIDNTDPFYSTYTSSRADSATKKDDGTFDQDMIKRVKLGIKRKIKQRDKLEIIRGIGYENIEKFLEKSFDVLNFERSDVVWTGHSRFEIGHVEFQYQGTIGDMTCDIYEYTHNIYSQTYRKIITLKKYYKDKANDI